MYFTCQTLAAMSDTHRSRLEPVVGRCGEQDDEVGGEPEHLHIDAMAAARTGPVGLLRALQDLHLLADLVLTSWTVIQQAARGLRDQELLEVARRRSLEAESPDQKTTGSPEAAWVAASW